MTITEKAYADLMKTGTIQVNGDYIHVNLTDMLKENGTAYEVAHKWSEEDGYFVYTFKVARPVKVSKPVRVVPVRNIEDFYVVSRSSHLMGGETWSDRGVTHIAEDGRTLCGVRVGSKQNGWFRDDCNPEHVFVNDIDSPLCERCKRSAENAGVQFKR